MIKQKDTTMFTDTKKRLLDLIKRKGSISIDQAINHTRLARTTLREHLLHLERDGLVKHEHMRSGPGRPGLKFKLTKEGNNLFPSYKPALISDLLKFLKERGDEMTVELFFEDFWNQRFEKAKRRMNEVSNMDPKSRLKALMSVLEEEGFMPEFKLDDDAKVFTIKACNCPFSEVIQQTHLPCKLEANFYKKLFGERVTRVAYIADGDYSCTYCIPIDRKLHTSSSNTKFPAEGK